MPTIHIPDYWAYEIAKAGRNVRKFVRAAVREKMEREGIPIVEREK